MAPMKNLKLLDKVEHKCVIQGENTWRLGEAGNITYWM